MIHSTRTSANGLTNFIIKCSTCSSNQNRSAWLKVLYSDANFALLLSRRIALLVMCQLFEPHRILFICMCNCQDICQPFALFWGEQLVLMMI